LYRQRAGGHEPEFTVNGEGGATNGRQGRASSAAPNGALNARHQITTRP
jgi:hypothetical protein